MWKNPRTFYILGKINFCMKSISWVYLFILKKQKQRKIKHHNSEQSRVRVHPLFLTAAGASQAAVSPFQSLWMWQAEMGAEVEGNWKFRQWLTVWSPGIICYFFHRSCFWAAFPSSGCKIQSCCRGHAPYLLAGTFPGNPQLYSDFVGFLGCPLCISGFPFRQSDQPKFQETTKEAVVTSQRIMSNEVAW